MTIPQLGMLLSMWVADIFGNWQAMTLVFLILAQLGTGVLAAIHQRRFEFTKLSAFVLDHFLPTLIAWGVVQALALAVAYASQSENIGLPVDLFRALPMVVWATLVLETIAYCYASVIEAGVPLPAIPGLPTNQPDPIPVQVVKT